MINLTRFNRRSVIYGIIIIWGVFVTLWYSSYSEKPTVIEMYEEESSTTDDNTPSNNYHKDKYKPMKLDIKNPSIEAMKKALKIVDKRKIDSHSTIYDYIFNNHDIDSIFELSFKDRCDLYFKNLYLYDNNWTIDPNKDFPLDHRYEFSYNDFKNNVKNSVKNEYAEQHNLDPEKVEFNDEIESMIKTKYESFWFNTMETEQEITDYLSHLRIFNKCYVTNDNKFQMSSVDKLINKEKSSRNKFALTEDEKLIDFKSFDSCNELESRIYRWLSFAYPLYERWTGESFLSPPKMKTFVNYPEVFQTSNSKFSTKLNNPSSEFGGDKSCFLNKFKNSLNGKGIVLSIGDKHVNDAVKLIHLLRALNNHYPIQIVYYDSFSEESKKRLVNAARSNMFDLPTSFNKVKQYFPSDYLSSDSGLPQQEIWFVNSYNAIHKNFRHKFDKFSNKFLAAIFNSFEEYMLIDADTVPLKNPDFFFNLKNYVKKGAYFYRDRTAPDFRPAADATFFQKITPSIIDNLIFDIPIITDHTMKLEFFQGMLQFMESGLVMINRNIHFNSVLTMIHLNFMKPVASRVYGDKEIFWLGFAVNGDELYHFNEFFAAAVGTETPPEERLTSKGTAPKAREICAAHPGHIDGEDGKSLVWFNSGFQYCGKTHLINYEEEVEKQWRLKSIKDPKELQTYYENPIPLRQAIIPPFKNKLETLCDNVEEEPNRGWFMDKGYCYSYLWCAYSRIGGVTSSGEENTQYGQFFDFDEKSIDLFQYYGDVWVNNE